LVQLSAVPMASGMWFWIEFRAASMREDWGAITKPTI
jgi:hypothetical protein